jgi:pilus assembly protein FimV
MRHHENARVEVPFRRANRICNMDNPLRNTVFFIAGSIAIAGLCLGTASTARGAGLGELRLASDLGQPLNAEIDIVSRNASEKNFSASLAPSLYQSSDAVDPALSSIRFKVVHRGGRSVLLLSTRQPVNGPYLQLPIELRSSTARVTRQYTVFLNPPSHSRSRGAQSIAAADSK